MSGFPDDWDLGVPLRKPRRRSWRPTSAPAVDLARRNDAQLVLIDQHEVYAPALESGLVRDEGVLYIDRATWQEAVDVPSLCPAGC